MWSDDNMMMTAWTLFAVARGKRECEPEEKDAMGHMDTTPGMLSATIVLVGEATPHDIRPTSPTSHN